MSLNEIQVSDVAKEIHRNIPRKDPRIIEIMLNLVNRDLSRLDIKKKLHWLSLGKWFKVDKWWNR